MMTPYIRQRLQRIGASVYECRHTDEWGISSPQLYAVEWQYREPSIMRLDEITAMLDRMDKHTQRKA